MPSILTIENVSRDFDGTILFADVTFGIQEGERVGLIGRNGSGKTTLLRMIAGLEQSDTGRIYVSGSPVVGYLSQNPTFDAEKTVLDTIFSSSDPRLGLLREYQEICAVLADSDGTDNRLLDRMSTISEAMDAADAWSLETEARIILDKLGIDDTTRVMGSLSGGERKRVAMAHALLEHPDLLILDEPTNHLDAETITWLEDFLIRYSGALLLVTHDRYFLERVVTRIVEIDRKGTQSFDGNYSYYLEKKQEQEEQREVEEHKRKQLAKSELAWLRSGAKARRTKQKARIERANDLLSRPAEESAKNVDIALGSRRLGKKILELRGVSKAYGDKRLIDDFTHVLRPGERVGIIGANGAGKSTLLEMIVGTVTPDAGEIETGETVVIGYYDQESRAMDDEMRIIDYVKEGAEVVRTADGSSVSASQMLERFLFAKKAQYNLIGNLSGGERRRLYLLRLLMSSPNLLILDEPTNDLDIATLQALEEYLEGFPGPAIVVSHDRYFLDRTIDHLFRFEGEGRIREYPGDYSAFLETREREASEAMRIKEERQAAAKTVQEKPKKQEDSGTPKKLSFNEKHELETLEVAIAEGEEEKTRMEEELASADYQKAPEIAEKISALTAELEEKMARWGELAERE